MTLPGFQSRRWCQLGARVQHAYTSGLTPLASPEHPRSHSPNGLKRSAVLHWRTCCSGGACVPPSGARLGALQSVAVDTAAQICARSSGLDLHAVQKNAGTRANSSSESQERGKNCFGFSTVTQLFGSLCLAIALRGQVATIPRVKRATLPYLRRVRALAYHDPRTVKAVKQRSRNPPYTRVAATTDRRQPSATFRSGRGHSGV